MEQLDKDGTMDGSITDVQKAAIQGFIRLKGLTLTNLSAAFVGRSIASLEELSHREAIKIIYHMIV